jgi:hypothetical protein
VFSFIFACSEPNNTEIFCPKDQGNVIGEIPAEIANLGSLERLVLSDKWLVTTPLMVEC